MNKHGDVSICRHCGELIRYWDANPNHTGAYWYHAGISTEINRVGEIIVHLESPDGWDHERIFLSRKEAKRFKRALKEALKNGKA